MDLQLPGDKFYLQVILFSIIITFYLDLFVSPVITTDTHRTIKMMWIADKVRQL